LVNTPPILEKDELIAIIDEPARFAGFTFETGLVDTMVRDACESEYAQGLARSTILPLVEFSLSLLWERREDGRLTFASYQAVNGITGSLSQWADQAFFKLSHEQQLVAKDILTRLVRLETDGNTVSTVTRKRLFLSEIDEDPTTMMIIKHLANHRLITSFSKENRVSIEYIHDAVIREWPMLNLFLREDQNFLAWRQTLQEAIYIWLSHQRDQDDLFRGKRLAEAKTWLSSREKVLTTGEKEFLHESIKRHIKEINAAKPERAKMRKISLVLAFSSLIIYLPIVIIQTLPKLPQGALGVGSVIFTICLFLFLSLVSAFVFADYMTRFDISTRNLNSLSRMLLMGGFGGAVGIFLFLGVSGQFSMWFAGALIGLTLAALPHSSRKKLGFPLRIGLSLTIATLTIWSGMIILSNVPEIIWQQKVTTVLAAGCFSGLYLFFAAGLHQAD
jgi:hypothetical protein